MNEFIPYCGIAPTPGNLRWNTDPFLISFLIGVATAYAFGARSPNRPNSTERTLFACGFAAAALALISPLCNLSVALFSARIGQHIILTLVAAPLITLGRPDCVILALAPRLRTTSLSQVPCTPLLLLATVVFAGCVWLWHSPGPYDATLQNNGIYWAMHASTFAAALLLWHCLVHAGKREPGPALAAGFVSAMQMSLLGAILTFAARPLFSVHSHTTAAWQLSQLEDQQLGGLIMWVPGGLLFLIYAMIAFGFLLQGLDERRRELPPQAAG